MFQRKHKRNRSTTREPKKVKLNQKNEKPRVEIAIIKLNFIERTKICRRIVTFHLRRVYFLIKIFKRRRSLKVSSKTN